MWTLKKAGKIKGGWGKNWKETQIMPKKVSWEHT
jgi:hypothetical protein